MRRSLPTLVRWLLVGSILAAVLIVASFYVPRTAPGFTHGVAGRTSTPIGASTPP